MSSLIERVKAHYKADELRHVDIPEWGEGGEPLKAAFYPATMRDVSMAMKAADNDPSRYNARLVALKLLDADGNRLFGMADGYDLEQSADPTVLTRLSLFIGGYLKPIEDVEKN
ncbi:MAG: hypothetical protein H6873_05645 [Hyphomicrobiaceae bacterium]|nr:hypothetical protein [Hyphomicrobiaceae bacterium]